MQKILATYREPFGLHPTVAYLKEGQSLQQMKESMFGLPADFDKHGVICINGIEAPRALWASIRPKPVAVTEVTFHMPPRGGGGEGGGKQILALIASIAITVVAGFATAGLFATSGGLFAAGTASAYLLAAGISLVGSLLISALIPPPSASEKNGRNRKDLGNASAEGNILEPNAPIPRVVGERKIYPPLGCEPFIYFDGVDEVVEAAYVLAGPHRIEDVRIGAAPIESIPGIEYEVIEGWQGSPLSQIVLQQSITESVQTEIRGHIISEDDGAEVDTETSDIANSLPQPQVVATRESPDEHQIQISFPQGLHKEASETNKLVVPFRIRIRKLGDVSWRNLPELHFRNAQIRQLRASIKFVWTDSEVGQASASSTTGWTEAHYSVPGQVTAPATSGWTADPYFHDGVGDDYVNTSNSGTTGLTNIILGRYDAFFVLDRSEFEPGRYEIEITRGCSFQSSSFVASSYQYSGNVRDFFRYYNVSPPLIPFSREGVSDTAYLLRSVSIWDEHPLPSRDLAIVAIRARNKTLDRVSCVAGGWVKDWDGTDWTDWTITSNPAPHLRDIYTGTENVDPIPLELIDENSLVNWRQRCIDMGYTCNAIIEDDSLDDAARIVASCGYAKPYMSDVWGVVQDYDRRYEDPVQLFTPRNTSNFSWTKAFAKLPDGFRVSYRDQYQDYDTRQITIYRDGVSDDNGRVEQVTFEGLVDEQDIIDRVHYDFAQIRYRNTFYSFDASAENILCRRGDLVAVQHDMLTEWSDSARVVSYETDSSGDVTAINLDVDVFVPSTYFLSDSLNLAEEQNLAALGLEGGVAIRRSNSVTIHRVSGSALNRLEFSPPISQEGIQEGSLITVGKVGSETLRLIVFGVVPKPNLEASITLVDEAPEIWN